MLQLLEGAQTQNRSLITGLTERRDKREEALRERQAKLLDIESRLKLAALLPQIEKAVDQAKWVDKAKIQQRKFQALLRSLTETSKLASEQLLNKDFERHFTKECKALRAPAGDAAVSRQAGPGHAEKGRRRWRTSTKRRALGRGAER